MLGGSPRRRAASGSALTSTSASSTAARVTPSEGKERPPRSSGLPRRTGAFDLDGGSRTSTVPSLPAAALLTSRRPVPATSRAVEQHVDAASAGADVGAAPAVDDVRAGVAPQRVVGVRTGHRFEPVEEVVAGASARLPCREVGGHAAGGGQVRHRVGPVTAAQIVVTGATV